MPLQEELAHIEEYISLEQIRFKDTLQVTFKKELKSKNLQIPPMLFIPFVENAFKHGTILLGTLEIAIQIQASEETIFFEVTNTASKLNSNTNPIGLGLQNIEKRLQLLYKNNFTLVSEQTKNSYSIKLTIHL